jgi:hypothetical protein
MLCEELLCWIELRKKLWGCGRGCWWKEDKASRETRRGLNIFSKTGELERGKTRGTKKFPRFAMARRVERVLNCSRL